MSYGGSSGWVEKLEHSTVLDILSIAVYAFFGWVAYNNLGFNQDDVTSVSTDPTVVAVQLAGVLILINIAFLLHDKVSGGGDSFH